MGLGGYLTLLNGGASDWKLGNQHSYQMDAWKWPTVNAGNIPLTKRNVSLRLTLSERNGSKGVR